MTPRQIRAAVRERDGFRCVECGMTSAEHRAAYGLDLAVHRVTPGSEYSTAPGVCVTLCRHCHAPKPKRRRSEMPQDAAVCIKVHRTLHRKLKMVAAGADQGLLQYVDLVLRQHVDAEFPRFLRDQS